MTTNTHTHPADHPFTDAQLDAASALIRQLPRDQALGLRLIALASACAAAHMTQAALAHAQPGVTEIELAALLGNSQAAGLVAFAQEMQEVPS